MLGRLAGKYALVTGASRGIGRAVAACFAADGAVVAVNHVNDEAAAAAVVASLHAASPVPAGHRVEEADIGAPEQYAELIERVTAAFVRLDILVNNAGIQIETPGVPEAGLPGLLVVEGRDRQPDADTGSGVR